MKDRIVILLIVVAVAIFIGVTITVQGVNNPLLQTLVAKQNEIIKLQRSLQNQIASAPAPVAQAAAGQDIAGLLQRQQDLERRIEALEKKLESTFAVLKQAQAAAAQRQGPPPEEFNKVYTIDVGQTPVKGNKNAPITIVEFLDFQCPYCSRFHPAVNEVMAAYPGEVNYMLKNYPLSFHAQAKPAAKAAFAAGEQGKYYEMVELLLQNIQNLNEEKFKELAKQLGLNVNRFMDDYTKKDAEWEKRIQADMELGNKIDVRGTPSYYLNGKKTQSRDLAAYKREIDAILQQK